MTESMQTQPSAETAAIRQEIGAISQVLLQQLQNMDEPLEASGEIPQVLANLGYVQDGRIDLRPFLKEISRTANMLSEPDFNRVLRNLYPYYRQKMGRSVQSDAQDGAPWWPFVELVAAAFIALGVSQDEMVAYLARSYGELPEDAALLKVQVKAMAPDRLSEEADRLYTEKRWWKRDYSLARQCMMAPGSNPATGEMRSRLFDIYQTRDENVRSLAYAVAFLALEVLFMMVFGENLLTGSPMAGAGAAAIIGSGLLLALAIVRYSRKPFNGLSGLVTAEFVCWALFALAAILS